MARVRKVMLSDVPTLKKEDKIADAARLLTKTEDCCLVVTENDMPVGIVTELDVLKYIAPGKKNFNDPVSGIMSSPVTYMYPSTKLDNALKIIDTKRFRKYPVVENGMLIGLVTKNDVVHAISDNVRLHRAIQNIVLMLFVVFELFVFFLYQPLAAYFGA